MKTQKIKLQKKWFTFVELIIASTILIILTSLWFYSYTKHISNSRDSQRKWNIASISSSLTLYKQKRWSFPNPWDFFTFRNGAWASIEVAKQWKLNEKVSLSTLDTLPLDPYIHIPYLYSITQNKQEFQLGATLENSDRPIAFIEWNYKTVAKNILPSLLIAYNGSGSIDITNSIYKNKFIFSGISYNLPYSLENGVPFSNNMVNFETLINDININFWQNGDFENCEQIYEAWKSIGNGEYQILNSSWGLESTGCIFP